MQVCDQVPLQFLFEANSEISGGAQAPCWVHVSARRPVHFTEVERIACWCFQAVRKRGAGD